MALAVLSGRNTDGLARERVAGCISLAANRRAQERGKTPFFCIFPQAFYANRAWSNNLSGVAVLVAHHRTVFTEKYRTRKLDYTRSSEWRVTSGWSDRVVLLMDRGGCKWLSLINVCRHS